MLINCFIKTKLKCLCNRYDNDDIADMGNIINDSNVKFFEDLVIYSTEFYEELKKIKVLKYIKNTLNGGEIWLG